MSKVAKILVLTLYSGENEFDLCKASVSEQKDVSVEHVTFENLPNAEAHRRLYSEIMARASDFDLFVKLDADMVISRPTALSEISTYFASRPTLDHLVVEVNDHFSGKRIAGVHTFSPRVRWNLEKGDALFVDPRPRCRGTRANFPPEIPVFVDHAPKPSRYQAFHFGFHRALKALQRERQGQRPLQAIYQIDVLRDVDRHYRRSGRDVLAYAVIGARMVWSGELSGHSGDKKDPDVERAFDRLAALDPVAVQALARKGRLGWYASMWRARLYFVVQDRMQTSKTLGRAKSKSLKA